MTTIAERNQQRSNCITLRNYIRDLDESEFDMSTYTHCISGHFSKIFGPHKDDINLMTKLGITHQQVLELVMPSGWSRPEKCRYTKDQAVDVLTQLIETGEFTWPPPQPV